jgi:hypothetical protein
LYQAKRYAPEPPSYNGLVLSWPEIMRLAGESALRAAEPARRSLI